MAKATEAVLEKIANLGVKNPRRPTAEEIKIILDAYVRRKELDVKSFEIYRGLIDSSLRTVFDGFLAFSKDETTITASALDIIKQALAVLQAELDRNLPFEQRSEIMNNIFTLVKEAREETKESRKHKNSIITKAVLVVSIVVTGIVYILNGSKSET